MCRSAAFNLKPGPACANITHARVRPLAVSIDKQARVTAKWLVEAVHCGGYNTCLLDFDTLQAWLKPQCSFRLAAPSMLAAPSRGSTSSALQAVSTVYVAHGYPKTLRYTDARPPMGSVGARQPAEVKHYALTVDVGLRCNMPAHARTCACACACACSATTECLSTHGRVSQLRGGSGQDR